MNITQIDGFNSWVNGHLQSSLIPDIFDKYFMFKKLLETIGYY